MITIEGMDGNAFQQDSADGFAGRFITTLNRLKFSGSYVAGGDTLDFSNGGASSVNSAVPPAQSRGIACVDPRANGPSGSLSNGNGNYIAVSPDTASPTNKVTTWKMKIYLANGSEYSAGAYGTDVTTDQVFLEVKWAR